jgi:hypothetical protein
LAATVRAIEDERRHARLCFGLASAFAGEQVGPGRLDVSGALPAPSLARSLATALVEGCIGETVAALEASELAAQVVDPVLRDALEGIAADERRHAELAWKFAHWAVSRDHSLSALLEQELERVQRELFEFNPPQAKPGDRDRAQAGVMPGAMRTAVRREALRRIVEPGLSGMIDHARARSAA